MVSIITPVYNSEKYIQETLKSVIDQTFEFWEHIIIDDGSKDNSIKIVKEVSNLDKRIKLLNRNREPKGANTCRNIGIHHAKSKYIIFLDSDDLLLKTCLENRLKVMQENDDYDACIFNMATFSDNKECNNKLLHEFLEIKPLYNFIIGQNSWSITAPIWLRSAVLKIGGFNESLKRMQDPEFHVRACLESDLKISYESIRLKNPDSFCRRNLTDINKVSNSVYIECSSKYFNLCLTNILKSENSLEERNNLLRTLSLFPLTSLHHLLKRGNNSKIAVRICIGNLESLSQYVEMFELRAIIYILSNPKTLNDKKESLKLLHSLKSICSLFSFDKDIIKTIINIICKYQPYGLLSILLNDKDYLLYGTGNCTKSIIKTSKKYFTTLPHKVIEYNYNNSVFMGIEVVDITNYSQTYFIIASSWSNQSLIKRKINEFRKFENLFEVYSIEEFFYKCLNSNAN